MPQIPKHRKAKKASVLIKKSQYLRNYLKSKSYKPLCEKLKNNNSSLAKALSKEKHESQLLYSQNVALVAAVQDLGVACNKRDTVISNVITNAKEMLKMLVTMSGYLTNTISTCQEFVASSAINVQTSSNNTEKEDAYRRLSAKSPTRGVVKPMVSGHTITKPTINLSRLNMQHINNSPNLSVIQEATTSPRSEELNRSRSSGHVTIRQHRNEDSCVYRMPERLTNSSPRSSDESERRLSKRTNRCSGRISGNISARLSSGNSSRSSTGNYQHIGSPRVKLNDVSKLLQNSQSINIRKLSKNLSSQGNDFIESDDCVNQDESLSDVKTLKITNNSKNNHDETIGNESEEETVDELDSTLKLKELDNETRGRISDLEDPLEGPSWLLDNTVPSFNDKDKKTDEVNVSTDDNRDTNFKTSELSDTSDEESVGENFSLTIGNKRDKNAGNSNKNKETSSKNECKVDRQNESNDTFYNASIMDESVTNGDECKVENEASANFSNFITQRRGCFESDDDDDFTLMYMRPRNMNFDINDLKLPVLEDSALKPIAPVEIEPEVTTTLKQISQICPIPSVSNETVHEFTFNQSTVKLPLVNNDDEKEMTPQKNGQEVSHRKIKSKKVPMSESTDFLNGTSKVGEGSKHKKKNKSLNKDPSAVKVVLQKLNESDVKSRTPSPEVAILQDSTKSLSPSLRVENSSDSENSNASSNSTTTSNRPRRKRAPISFQEPSLRTKLRRNR